MAVARRAALLVLLAAALVEPALAAGWNRPVLLLLGKGNTHADVTLRTSMVLHKRGYEFTTSGCGRYGGFYLQPLNRPYTGATTPDFGLFDPARFDYTDLFYRKPLGLGRAALGNTGPDLGNSTVSLPPGRYRAHLLGEGNNCRVRMPVVSGLAETLTVRTAAASGVHFDEAALDIGVATGRGPRIGVGRFPVTVDANTYVLSAVHYWTRTFGQPTDLDGARLTSACIDQIPVGTCSPTHVVSDKVVEYETRRYPDGSSVTAGTTFEYVRPGELAPGTVYGKALAYSAAGEWTVTAAALAIDLV